jgi:hypothetical protein
VVREVPARVIAVQPKHMLRVSRHMAKSVESAQLAGLVQVLLTLVGIKEKKDEQPDQGQGSESHSLCRPHQLNKYTEKEF